MPDKTATKPRTTPGRGKSYHEMKLQRDWNIAR